MVYNADEFRWGGTYFWRPRIASAPHNVYTDGELPADAWQSGSAPRTRRSSRPGTFAPDAPLDQRPSAGRSGRLPGETDHLPYDRDDQHVPALDHRRRSRSATVSTGKRVAPKNVVILRMAFGPLNDGHPEKQRLEAENVGKGVA